MGITADRDGESFSSTPGDIMNAMIRRSAAAAFAMAALALQASSVQAGICVGDKCSSDASGTNTFSESPVTQGFWSWPRSKPKDATEIAATCRDTMALVLADGRYLGIHFTKQATEAGRAPFSAKLVDRGACRFDPATQIERCDLTVTDKPGESNSGFISARYVVESDGTLKASIEGTTLEGPNKGKTEAFDIYPVRCPDDVVHELILSVLPTP
jgi:hypothetical protein